MTEELSYLDDLPTDTLARLSKLNINFTLLPIEILLDDRLPPRTKLIYSLILATDRCDDGSFLDNDYLCSILNVNQKTISTAYTLLEELGLITVKHGRIKRYVSANYRIGMTVEPSRKLLVKPSRKSLGSLKNIETKINTSSSKKLDSDFEKPKSLVKTNPFIDHWNNQSFTRKHKQKQKNTQTVKKIIKHLRFLKKGTFSKYTFDEKWIETNRISKALLNKSWSDTSIKNAITRLAQLFDPAYWPQNKNNLPQDLATLIYNPHTRKSLFLQFNKEPPKLLDSILSDVKDKNLTVDEQDALGLLISVTSEHINGKAISSGERRSLIKTVKRLGSKQAASDFRFFIMKSRGRSDIKYMGSSGVLVNGFLSGTES